MEFIGEEVNDYIEEKVKERKPKNKEEFLELLDEAIHELRISGRIRKDADIREIKAFFIKRLHRFSR